MMHVEFCTEALKLDIGGDLQLILQFTKRNSMEMESHKNKAGHALDDDGREKRTGTVVTASAHIITAVIGSGVLSLAWAMAQLGWALGLIVLISFALITWYCSTLQADCYRSSNGKRNYTYTEAVRSLLGEMHVKACGVVQFSNLIGVTISYAITTAISMAAVKKSNCFHRNGHDAKCDENLTVYMLYFAIIEIVLSQIPNFHKIWWLSIVAAVMSFTYSLIGLGLAIAKVAEGGHGMVRTSLTGVSVGVGLSISEKVWQMLQSLGNVASAFTFSLVLIEIQDTLKSSPPENVVMKLASLIGVLTTTVFYMLCGVFGYLAFGDAAPGNFLTGFGFYDPFWLVDIGNICIVIHLLGAYQVFCQPVFQFAETWVSSLYQNRRSNVLTSNYTITLPFYEFEFNISRIIWRTLYVLITAFIAVALPFFNSFLGIIGGIGFWPLTVYFPVQMYIAQAKVNKWTLMWVWLKTLSFVCLLVSIAAVCGSVQGLIHDVRAIKSYKIF